MWIDWGFHCGYDITVYGIYQTLTVGSALQWMVSSFGNNERVINSLHEISLKKFPFLQFFSFFHIFFFFQFRFLCHNSWISYWIALVVTVECVRHFYHRMKIKTDTCLRGIQKCQVSKSSHFQLHLLSVGHLVKQFYDEHISINF